MDVNAVWVKVESAGRWELLVRHPDTGQWRVKAHINNTILDMKDRQRVLADLGQDMGLMDMELLAMATLAPWVEPTEPL